MTEGTISSDVDDEEPTTANPNSGVQEIIDIFAVDLPNDGIGRLVQMMRNICGCTVKNGE